MKIYSTHEIDVSFTRTPKVELNVKELNSLDNFQKSNISSFLIQSRSIFYLINTESQDYYSIISE